MARSAALVLLAAALLVACEDAADPPTREVVRRDSAGVAIVETRGDIWSAPTEWTASAASVVEIGSVDGSPEYLLSQVRGVIELTDGRIVVADGGSSTLRWYDEGGVFLFERGGAGEGPGEFRFLGAPVRSGGDTVAVTDLGLRRITEFSPSGDLARTTAVSGVQVPGNAYRIRGGEFLVGSDGFSSTQMTGTESGMGRANAPIVRIGGGLEAPDTIGMFPGPEMYFVGGGFGSHPFGRWLSYAVQDGRLFVAASEGFVIDAFSADGQQTQSIRAPDVDLRLTPERIEQYTRSLQDSASEGSGAAATLRALEAMDMFFPDTRPAYGRLVVGDSSLWLEEHQASRAGDPNRWAVFELDGTFRGIAQLPERFRLRDVRGERLLGSWRDDLDVEYVRVYRVVEVDGR